MNLKRVISDKKMPYILCTIYFLVLNLYGFVAIGDDCRALEDLKNAVSYGSWKYKNENARHILNYTAYVVLKLDPRVCMLINALMMTVICAGLHYILFSKKTVFTGYLMFIMMLLFPFNLGISTGWYMTPIAYLWTAACAVIALMPLRRYLDGIKTGMPLYLLCILCLIFAANKEDLAVLLFVLFAAIFVMTVVKKKKSWYFLVAAVICAAEAIYGLLASSNQARMEDTHSSDLKLIESLDIGFTATLQRFILNYDFVFLLLLVVLLVVVFCRKEKVVWKLTAGFPMLVWLVFGLFFGLYLGDLNNRYVFNDLLDGSTILNGKYEDVKMLIAEFVILLAWISIFALIGHIFGKTGKTKLIFIALISGILGRTTIGFAGNMQFYFDRTFVFLYFILLSVTALLVENIWKELSATGKQRLIECLVLFAVCMVAFNIWNINQVLRLATEIGA